MNKKSLVYPIFILVLFVFSVYLVDGFGFIERNSLSTNFNATLESNASHTSSCTVFSNDSSDCRVEYNDLTNWTRGGNTELYWFKINISNSTTVRGLSNVSRINITIPSEVAFIGLGKHSVDQNATFESGGAVSNWTINITGSEISVFNATAQPLMTQGGAFETIYIPFNVTVANGTTEQVVNWTVTLYVNETNGTIPYLFDDGFGMLTGVDGLPPRVTLHNVTDGVNTRTTLTSTQYLIYDSSNPIKGINITLTATDYNLDRVLLVYNNTGGSINLAHIREILHTNIMNANTSAFDNVTVMENSSVAFGLQSNITSMPSHSGGDLRLSEAPSTVFRFNISNSTWGTGAADGTQFNYVFVVYDLYNHSEIINNSNAAFTLVRDTKLPSIVFTKPSDTSINVFRPIKYTCDGSDTSGLASCVTTITKPSSTTVVKTGCGTEQTFTLDDTNEAGTYIITCKVADNVGKDASESATFAVSSSGGSSGSSGGSSGSSGGSSGGTVEVITEAVGPGETKAVGDLVLTQVTQVSEGGTVSFNIGSNSHMAEVLSVGTTSVTLEIRSHPQEITLDIGESKTVDTDDNEEMDLEVTLNAITNGKADLTFRNLLVEPEVEATTTTIAGTAGGVTGDEGGIPAWLWVVIIIVIIIIIVVMKKKKA
ncbi:hypothetical protein CL617_03445 [archaeon]|nr:hypothetical protein [archaeon]|tara:strand:- start:7114 stop:9078 length:1965 start_codon:yes stop_codon:yes gene_type:complete